MATVTLAGLQGAPEYLYHYTSIHAVDGILKNRVVWASVLHFLNDSKEWKHAIELAQDQLLKLQGPICKQEKPLRINSRKRLDRCFSAVCRGRTWP